MRWRRDGDDDDDPIRRLLSIGISLRPTVIRWARVSRPRPDPRVALETAREDGGGRPTRTSGSGVRQVGARRHGGNPRDLERSGGGRSMNSDRKELCVD